MEPVADEEGEGDDGQQTTDDGRKSGPRTG